MKKLLTICCIMIASSSDAQIKASLDSVLQTGASNQPGIALYVEHKGKAIYKGAFGSSDIQDGTPLNASSNFRMASVSKQFTAMCIALLEKSGKLSFDDAISKFFPELPSPVSQRIQVRHLLNHTSGIWDYESLMADDFKGQILDQGVLDLLAKKDSVYFEAGSRFRYSNSAYALLALIVERVSGMTFLEYMRKSIFLPLGMRNSYVYAAEQKIPKRVMGFARNRAGEIYPRDQSTTSAVKGDGGVYTSLNDYRKWTNGLWENKLLNMDATLAKLNSPIKQLTGSAYGPGWFYFDKGIPSLFHSGSTCGFSTFSINIPSERTSIVYFSNVAGNAAPFRAVLEKLRAAGISTPAEVFELHELTR